MKLRALITLALLAAISGCVPSESIQRTQAINEKPCIEGIDITSYQNALKGLNKDTSPADTGPYSQYVRGVAFYCASRHARSIEALSLALSIDPSHYRALMLRARVYIETGKTGQALDDLAAAADADPSSPEPLIERGNIHLSMELHSKAGNDFVSAIKRFPKSVAAHVGLADIYAAQGQFEKALSFYDRALRFDPDSADAYAARGLMYFETDDFKRSVEDLERAGSIDPKLSIRLAESRGFAHFFIGDHMQAADAFSEIISSEPVPPSDIITMRALAYFNAGKHDMALRDSALAVELAPDDPRMHYNHANFLARTGRTSEALKSYNESIKLDPDYYEALLNRGKVYFDTGKYFRSLVDYNRAVELRPDLVQGYVHRGSAYVAAEMYRQAEEDFSMVLEKDPGFIDIIIAMSELSAVRGAPLDTCIWLNKAVALGYSDWQYVWDSPAFGPVRHEECYKDIVPPSPQQEEESNSPLAPVPGDPAQDVKTP
ncbi:MAG: tetratricopeptide repeat protein [Thermodesulfovibrionales bacterium]|nr:tetratricopeptide repeat protein [Thermodesulfovibrionales bacterium]